MKWFDRIFIFDPGKEGIEVADVVHSTFLLFHIQQLYPTTLLRMIGRIIIDITQLLQVADAFVVGGGGKDLCFLHDLGPGNVDVVFVLLHMPIMIQQKINGDMGGLHLPVGRYFIEEG
jgi:hypothetical protein